MNRIAPPAWLGDDWTRPLLEIKDLTLVLSLERAGSTARAASALHITQSAVSRALSQAEEKLGARLFERNPRGLTPTAAGERLIAGARIILEQLSELERKTVSPMAAPTRIRLVCECYTAYRWLPSTMANLCQRMPNLQIEIAFEHTQDPVGALVDHEIDVALLTNGVLPNTPEARRALLERRLFSDEIVFVVSASHPLAGAKFITREDLQNHTLITANTPPSEAQRFLTAVFGRRKPRLTFLRFPLTEAVIEAARAQMGIAVLSEWIASSYLLAGHLLVKRLASGPLERPWRIAYRREVAEAAERLMLALSSFTRGGAPFHALA